MFLAVAISSLVQRFYKKVGKENIKLIATKQKLAALPQKRLYVDTGDDAVNKLLSGYIRVVVGYQYEVLMPIGC
jgi:predicted polyphosphate/ATP-dependent NAD kinase